MRNPFSPSPSHLAGGYGSLEGVMWLQWLVARAWRRPLRLRLGLESREVSFCAPLEHSPMAPVSLGLKLNSHSWNLGMGTASCMAGLEPLCTPVRPEDLWVLASLVIFSSSLKPHQVIHSCPLLLSLPLLPLLLFPSSFLFFLMDIFIQR